MTQHLHQIITPRDPPEPSIYDQVRDLMDEAEAFENSRHPVEAMIAMTNARLLLASYLDARAH
jgi:hypothetical protein